MEVKVLKGNIIYSDTPQKLNFLENGYLVIEGGISQGIFARIPKKWEGYPVTDYGNCLIVPGLSDIHLHAPQYSFRCLGMDLELLDWLNTYTFPEESKYKDLDYAKKAYTMFVEDLKKSGTTRVCVFATIHTKATELLMKLLEESGICGYVGKVSMNRNSPDYLREEDSLGAVEEWLDEIRGKYHRIQPVLTPRFTPSCTDDVVQGLAEIQKREGMPIQSHLSENLSEISWVQELSPESTCYGDAYDRLGAFGSNGKAVMAHCVYSGEEEMGLMKKRGVFIAHCPQSNTNLASGIAPAKRYLEEGFSIGLGSDVAGGAHLSIFRAMADAISVSKLRWRVQDQAWKPLTVEEAFFMGTKGGGAFFGKVGSFEKGYEADALVIDDSSISHPQDLTLRDRLERLIYMPEQVKMIHRYIRGEEFM